MSPRDLVYVGHMLDMARKAVAKVRDLPRETYDADENLRLALIYLVQVIGEAACQVSRDFTVSHPEIPWERPGAALAAQFTPPLGPSETVCRLIGKAKSPGGDTRRRPPNQSLDRRFSGLCTDVG